MDSYKGKNLTLWFEFKDESCLASGREHIQYCILSHLENNPSPPEANERFNPNKLFLDYPVNTLIFFAPTDNALQPYLDSLGKAVVERVCTIAFSIIKTTTPTQENILKQLERIFSMQFLYIENAFGLADNLLKSCCALEQRRLNLTRNEYDALKKKLKCDLIQHTKFLEDNTSDIPECTAFNPEAEEEWVKMTAELFETDGHLARFGRKAGALINELNNSILYLFDFPPAMNLQLLLTLRCQMQRLKKGS